MGFPTLLPSLGSLLFHMKPNSSDVNVPPTNDLTVGLFVYVMFQKIHAHVLTRDAVFPMVVIFMISFCVCPLKAPVFAVLEPPPRHHAGS